MKLLSKVAPLGSKQVRKGVVSSVWPSGGLPSVISPLKPLALLPACFDESPLSSTLVPLLHPKRLHFKESSGMALHHLPHSLSDPPNPFLQDLRLPSIMPCLPALPALYTLSLAHPSCAYIYTHNSEHTPRISAHTALSLIPKFLPPLKSSFPCP